MRLLPLVTCITAASILSACGGSSSSDSDSTLDNARKVLNTNAEIAYAVYSDSVDTAKALQTAINELATAAANATDASDTTLIAAHKAAKKAWLVAREPYGQSEVRYKHGNKSINVLVKYDDYIIQCVLNYGVSEVRKTSYEWKFMNSQGITTYDCYSVNQNEKTICSLSDIGSNCNFYLRGFDFSNQCQRLLNQKGDLMKSTALKEIDKIVSTISD